MIRIYVMNISSLTDEKQYEKAYRLSSSERKKKADALKNAPDKARCIGAGLLLKEAFFRFCNEYEKKEQSGAQKDGQNPAGRVGMPQEKADEHGRPYLAGEGEKVLTTADDGVRSTALIPFISISHAGDYVAVAMADKRIGVDIERNRKISDSLARRLLSDAEQREWEYLQKEQSNRFLLRIWTRKEAAAKLDGRGIFTMLGELSANDWANKLCLYSRELGGDYILSWAVN